ncbi:uncharacterized protein LOC124146915 isoform X1 [Haliotis rufescens]|uniref:uncharacterized protein LOC124146915 isoform X1 n=1 Tax=Haliotis rufescens TaxID=6454 RepID=UPI001EAFA757|nr:uncharacterized protein LOC124146915 isoform X1 [Haliotis rufescens]
MGDAARSSAPTSREASLWLPRFRKKGEKILHSKYIVIFVIILTITDCALVIGELILDLYSVKKTLRTNSDRTKGFVDNIRNKYPREFSPGYIDVDAFYNRIVAARIMWSSVENITAAEYLNTGNDSHQTGGARERRETQGAYFTEGNYGSFNISNDSAISDHVTSAGYKQHHDEHSRETQIAHKLHYASLCVLSILLIEVSLKILCAGSHFVKRKIEVFDALIILASFIVDLVFLKGLADFAIDDSIFILAFLLPWRVIRVVNSLLVAVIDHEHVKLRLLYSRKKKLDKTVENLRNEVDELKGLLQDVRSFCVKEGLEEWKLDNLLGRFAPRRRKDSKFYTLVKLVMSTASVADDKDSVSSSSMEMEINEFARRNTVLNDEGSTCTSNENTVSSINFLTVPTYDDCRSMSDNESDKGDSSRRSSFNDLNSASKKKRKKSPNRVNFKIP